MKYLCLLILAMQLQACLQDDFDELKEVADDRIAITSKPYGCHKTMYL